MCFANSYSTSPLYHGFEVCMGFVLPFVLLFVPLGLCPWPLRVDKTALRLVQIACTLQSHGTTFTCHISGLVKTSWAY